MRIKYFVFLIPIILLGCSTLKDHNTSIDKIDPPIVGIDVYLQSYTTEIEDKIYFDILFAQYYTKNKILFKIKNIRYIDSNTKDGPIEILTKIKDPSTISVVYLNDNDFMRCNNYAGLTLMNFNLCIIFGQYNFGGSVTPHEIFHALGLLHTFDPFEPFTDTYSNEEWKYKYHSFPSLYNNIMNYTTINPEYLELSDQQIDFIIKSIEERNLTFND